MKIPESAHVIALKKAILMAVHQLGYESSDQVIHLEHPAQSDFGDYSTNVAMTLKSPAESSAQNPRSRAEQIAAILQTELATAHGEAKQFISKVEVAGPGFINFYLTEDFLMAEIGRVVRKRTPIVSTLSKPKKAIVEYSSPNIAKPFTIGHLRSTIIGDAVATILETVGYQVFRDNHVGDWGTQFGKLVYAIKTWGDETAIENSERPIKELVDLYVLFHKKAEENPQLDDEGRAWFSKLEAGDPEARRLWQKCIDWSWQEFTAIYDKLHISFTENNGRGYGESYFEDKMDGVVKELRASGMMKESDGAELVFFPNDSYPPLMILKKDGSTLYATRDLATDFFRLQKYGKDILIINEVGGEQSLYFQQLYAIETALGWYKPGQRVHVKHGLYRFKDSKMSTRKGNVIWLEDILQEAFSRVAVQAKNKLSEAEIWKIAIAAVKWHDLKRESSRDIVFNYDEMLSLQGNTGPYIQYTAVRCRSLLQKGGFEVAPLTAFDATLYSLSQKERALAAHLVRFSEVVSTAAESYQPHHVATYLNEVAQAFNSFYSDSAVLDASVSESARTLRLQLVDATAITLHKGMGLLGIDLVEKM